MGRRKIRVRQRDLMDCGAACLASVSGYYKLQIPVAKIRQLAGTRQAGTSLLGLQEGAAKLGFQARGVRVNPEQADAVPLPAIYHVTGKNGLQHFVVGYRRSGSGFRCMDPAVGKMLRKKKVDFLKEWTGIVLLLAPGPDFIRGNRKISVVRRFMELIAPHRSMLSMAVPGAVLYTILGLSVPVFVQKIIDNVLPEGNLRLLTIMGTSVIFLLLVQQLAAYMKSLIALRTGQQIDLRLIMGYYRHLMGLPQTFFDSMRVGEIVSRVNDALRIRFFINDAALGIVVQLLTAGFSLAAMMLYSWKLALIVLAMIPVYILLYYVNDRLNARYQRQTMERNAELETQLVETVKGIATLKWFTAEQWATDRTERKTIPLMRTIYQSSRQSLLMSGVSEGSTRLLGIALLWAGSYAVLHDEISAGTLLSFYALAEYFTTPVIALIAGNRVMQDALIAADRLFEIIDLETENGNPGITALPEGDVFFQNVQFRYGPGKRVFHGFDCRFFRGKTTAVVGESGSGKSTLAALLLRMYEPQEGAVFIGHTDLRQIGLKTLRTRIGIVPQQTELFQGSVLENIALGETTPDLPRIAALLVRLGLNDFIQSLPGQWHAAVSESGTNLSGGQRQRVALARAIYRDPSILVLDEATASLDPDSERRVLETLSWFASLGRTIIIITHRLSTIKYCDRVLWLEKGMLVAEGRHEDLLRENARYAHWWQLSGME